MAKAKAVRKRARKSPVKSKRKPAKSSAGKRKVAAKKSAAKARKPVAKRRKAASGLLTLTEVSKRTGISMPTLQRYKKEYQRRIPSEGTGRKQRYKLESLPIFQQIKQENLKKRGRPRKSASAVARKPKAAARRGGTPKGLLSLSEIGRRTGISYPTLLRYVKLYGDRMPSEGSGRKRRFHQKAVPVFVQLRKESRRGRRKGSGKKVATGGGDQGVAARLRAIERQQAKLTKQISSLVNALKSPLRLTVKGL